MLLLIVKLFLNKKVLDKIKITIFFVYFKEKARFI